MGCFSHYFKKYFALLLFLLTHSRFVYVTVLNYVPQFSTPQFIFLHSFFSLFFELYYLIDLSSSLQGFFFNLFLSVLDLCCCAWALSSCSQWGLVFIVVHGLFTVVASPVAEHRL